MWNYIRPLKKLTLLISSWVCCVLGANNVSSMMNPRQCVTTNTHNVSLKDGLIKSLIHNSLQNKFKFNFFIYIF